MARHIMAVCVVCLLCAEHLPCKEHVLTSDRQSNNTNTVGHNNQIVTIDEHVGEIQYNASQVTMKSSHFSDKRKEKRLVKRHSHDHDHHDHHHHEYIDQDIDPQVIQIKKDIKKKIDEFTNKLFSEYGDSELKTMNITGFETMMKSLDLYHLLTDSAASESSMGSDDSNTCVNSVNFLRRTTIQSHSDHHDHNDHNHDHDDHERPHSISEISSKNITSLEHWKQILRLNKEDLQNICPILLYQLTRKNSTLKAGCIQAEFLPQIVNYTEPHIDAEGIDKLVWVYSSLAVLGVSLCGLLGVAVIPCMDKHFYHHVLQFLVALAVGTLCGDALLHLLPHAMMEQTLDNPHDDAMFKGLAAVGGIIFFYFMERILTVVAEFYKGRQKMEKPSSRVRVMKDPDACSLHKTSTKEKQCMHKYSSYPYCYDEIAMETKDDHHEHNHIVQPHLNNHNSNFVKCSNHGEHGDHSSEYAGLNSKEESTLDNNTISTNLDDASIESEIMNSHHHHHHRLPAGKILPESYTIILREHETKHHGHSHTHGHVHSPPGSFSAVAWMVIMGDGLHNFTDGMTIGAAFANNLAGGFSTAIAVFCHELPHELGDFAVLLKAGMSASQAVYYNMLSSLLSFFGMLLGIYFGNTPEASAWVFSVAAGLFIYIALVDMVPELTSSHGAEERCKTSEFILQFSGMTLGFLIMLLIAKYEHELKMIFVPVK